MKKKATDTKPNDIVVGTGSKKPKLSKRNMVIAGVILLVLVVGTIGTAVYKANHKAHPPMAVDCEPYINNIQTELNRQGYDNVIKLVDLYSSKGCPDIQKNTLLEMKGTALLSQQKYDEAEVVFKQVEQQGKGKLDLIAALDLATLSLRKGDKTAAISYYKAAIQALKDSTNKIDDAQIPGYQNAIKALGGTP